MTKRLVKSSFLIIGTFVLICLVTPFNNWMKNRSVTHQIHYLSKILDNGYDDELQKRFPEGKVFSNSLLALSIIEHSLKSDFSQTHYSQIVDNCILRILSDVSTSNFNSSLTPKFGAFYNGWTLFVLRSYQESPLFAKCTIKDITIEQADIIEERLLRAQAETVSILDSYDGANWPADNLMCIAKLKNKVIKKQWMQVIMSATNHPSSLIHHSGYNNSEIRGSSSAIMAYALSQIDAQLGKKYNEIYKNSFVDTFFGIELVKEHNSKENFIDADSGPILLGYGASATIMNIKTQSNFNMLNAKLTWAVFNVISLPISTLNQKFYLFQQEPMLDLFMLWASVGL